MAVDVRSIACTYLRNGKVTVELAGPPGVVPPATIVATVEGNSGSYDVVRDSIGWACSCGQADACAHAAAVQLVTGHDGLARKSGESG